jgi:hypothetical protein
MSLRELSEAGFIDKIDDRFIISEAGKEKIKV